MCKTIQLLWLQLAALLCAAKGMASGAAIICCYIGS
jgi:hypothetical protein